ncbi:MAG: metallophosphoesterase [Methanobacteriota archaeon]
MDSIQLLPGVFATADFGIWFERERAFAVADLHLGYEAEARAEGASVPSTQYKVIEKRIEAIIKRYEPSRLVIAGDLKHSLGRNRRQEWDEVNGLLDLLNGRCEPVILKGNHDNFLGTILRRRKLDMRDSLRIGQFAIAHGHLKARRPAKGWLAIGHEHPSLRVRDELGARAGAPCFLWSSAERVVVLPAFSPISFGRSVTGRDVEPLSPMLGSFDDYSAAAVSDGELLMFGKVAGLPKHGR